ncbi:hypothetical protein D1BOALGB6SA_8788 [Olavius sp. associated proteobacterium Delta 1]|nr:hypothetical protein D1BOALGB6SA_8788 [Olavius sp. associated proteobacterium Delta 1]
MQFDHMNNQGLPSQMPYHQMTNIEPQKNSSPVDLKKAFLVIMGLFLMALIILVLGVCVMFIDEIAGLMAGASLFVLDDFRTVLRHGFSTPTGLRAAFKLILLAIFIGWVIKRFKS